MPNARRKEAPVVVRQRYIIRFDEPQDIECIILGEMGLTTAAIASRSELSEGQVLYRLKKADIKRSDYRSGESKFAQHALRLMRDRMENHVRHTIAPRFRS